jgi:hypothetical protein
LALPADEARIDRQSRLSHNLVNESEALGAKASAPP